MDLLNDDVKRINLCFWSFINIYAFCEMGHTVTNQFDAFELELEQCKWHLFDKKLQRIYLIFLAIVEQQTTINGYGNIECVRVSLKRVISHVYTECDQHCHGYLWFCIIFSFDSIQCRPLAQVSRTSWHFVKLIELDDWIKFLELLDDQHNLYSDYWRSWPNNLLWFNLIVG